MGRRRCRVSSSCLRVLRAVSRVVVFIVVVVVVDARLCRLIVSSVSINICVSRSIDQLAAATAAVAVTGLRCRAPAPAAQLRYQSIILSVVF